jgi:hypothetical protein
MLCHVTHVDDADVPTNFTKTQESFRVYLFIL